jgi:hypothetical protein
VVIALGVRSPSEQFTGREEIVERYRWTKLG